MLIEIQCHLAERWCETSDNWKIKQFSTSPSHFILSPGFVRQVLCCGFPEEAFFKSRAQIQSDSNWCKVNSDPVLLFLWNADVCYVHSCTSNILIIHTLRDTAATVSRVTNRTRLACALWLSACLCFTFVIVPLTDNTSCALFRSRALFDWWSMFHTCVDGCWRQSVPFLHFSSVIEEWKW